MSIGHRVITKAPLVLLSVVLSACAATRTITVRESPQATTWRSATTPRNCHYVVRDPANKIIQETTIKNGRIVSSWEYIDYTMTTPEYADAVESGKAKAFEPYWAETVANGDGIRNLFSPAGKKVGFENVSDGMAR